MDKKILISGTGRSGTTFLIKLFTFLYMDTGWTTGNYQDSVYTNCNAGMEHGPDAIIRNEAERASPSASVKHLPYILKSPELFLRIPQIIKIVNIEYMIIPIRDYDESASSRAGLGRNVAGGIWNAKDKETQINFYYKIMAEYLVQMVRYDINTIFIDFKKMIEDKGYLYDKLKPIMEKHKVDRTVFDEAYDSATSSSRPETDEKS